MDFVAKRKEALARLGECYATEVLRKTDGTPSGRNRIAEVWAVTVEVEVDGEVRDVRLELRVPFDFPLSLPRPHLPKRDLAGLGPLPHVDANGFVCTFDAATVQTDPDAPGEIAVACVSRAARLLEAGLNGAGGADYEDEFRAYWSLPDEAGGAAETGWLSLLGGTVEGPVRCASLSPPYGKYRYVLHDDGAGWERFKHALESAGVAFTEREVYFAGELPVGWPPYNLKNGDAAQLLDEAGQSEPFRRYVNKGVGDPVVVFIKRLAGQDLVLGWRHSRPKITRKGFRSGSLRPHRALTTFERGRPVTRLLPEDVTPERLRFRTAGDPEPEAGPALFVTGLGSIGSLLVGQLGPYFPSRVGLLDPDSLTSENVARHLLGFSAVGENKASGVRAHLLDRNPFLPVTTVEDLRFAEALQANPELLSGFDRLLLATGDTATEMWVAEELAARRITTPTFFLWVEPYLAGGHCVYLRPGAPALRSLFEAGLYRWNAIAPEEYESRYFIKREAGCQTSFVPYAPAHAARFVATIIPHVIDACLDDSVPGFRITWTGPLDAVRAEGVTLSDHALAAGPFAFRREVLGD